MKVYLVLAMRTANYFFNSLFLNKYLCLWIFGSVAIICCNFWISNHLCFFFFFF